MNEIKCPNCGEEFSIDESYYNKIVKQIRDKEFAKEVKNIEAKYDKDMEHLLQLSRLELQKGFDEELADKDAEIVKLKAKLEKEQTEFYAKLNCFIAEKDKQVGELKNKLKTYDSDKAVEIANVMADASKTIASHEKFIMELTQESELALKEYQLKEKTLIRYLRYTLFHASFGN